MSSRELFAGKTFIDAIVCRWGDAAGATIALIGATLLRLSFSSGKFPVRIWSQNWAESWI